MDVSSIDQVAAALWPLIATGALGRLGERGTDEATTHLGRLWARVQESRHAKGLDVAPVSEEELREELAALSGEPDVAASLQLLVNHFHGPVVAPGANFGITNTKM